MRSFEVKKYNWIGHISSNGHVNSCDINLRVSWDWPENLNWQTLVVLNRIRVGLLTNLERFTHNFSDTPNPNCPCNFHSQNSKHVILDCTLLNNERETLFRSLDELETLEKFQALTMAKELDFLFYGHNELAAYTNEKVLLAFSKFLFDSKRLFKNCLNFSSSWI